MQGIVGYFKFKTNTITKLKQIQTQIMLRMSRCCANDFNFGDTDEANTDTIMQGSIGYFKSKTNTITRSSQYGSIQIQKRWINRSIQSNCINAKLIELCPNTGFL